MLQRGPAPLHEVPLGQFGQFGRGLPEEIAKQLVIEGFLAALVERFEPGAVRDVLAEALERRLGLVLAG